MLSCDKTEVINFNWSFESAHANVAVGRRRNTAGSTKPAGWYYEVQVMTQGIMQIGEFFTNLTKYFCRHIDQLEQVIPFCELIMGSLYLCGLPTTLLSAE